MHVAWAFLKYNLSLKHRLDLIESLLCLRDNCIAWKLVSAFISVGSARNRRAL